MAENKKKNSPLLYLSGTCLITICVASVGYSAYIISSTAEKEAGLSVVASEVSKSGLKIEVTSSTSQVLFDSMYLDSYGRVTSNSTSETTPKIEVIGYVENYNESAFLGVNPVLQVDSTDRDNYDYLIDNNYIVEPSFAQLGVTSDYDATSSTENSFYWTMAETEQRFFKLSYEYEYGSFFNYMNPSDFFDSDESNGIKKGSDYTAAEIKEILNHFADVSETSYTLYLDIMTEDSLFSVTLDADSGYFSSTDTTTTSYTISNLTYHSKVDPITPYKDDYIFQYWKYSTSSTQHTGYFFINELATFSTGADITVTAQYIAASSTLTVQYTNSNNSSATISFNVTSSDGVTQCSSTYGGTTSFSVKIGDVITITSKSGVKTISAGSGLTAMSMTSFKVTATTCVLSVTPAAVYTISFTLLSGSTALSDMRFMAGSSTVTYSSSSFNTVTVTEGDSITLTNIRGIKNFTYGSSSGSTLTISNITSNISVTVTPASEYTLTFIMGGSGSSLSFVEMTATSNNEETPISYNTGSASSTVGSGTSLGTAKVVEGDAVTLTAGRGIASFLVGSTAYASGSSFTPTGDTTVYAVPVDTSSLVTLTINYTNTYSSRATFKCNVKCGTETIASISTSSASSTFTYYYAVGDSWSLTDMEEGSVSSGGSSGTMTSNGATVSIKGTESCLLPGTLITMADGSYKVVEDIMPGDEVMVFDHATGKISTSFISVADYGEAKEVFVMDLNFSNRKTVKVVSEHGFFDVDLNNYVYINEKTYKDFIGHRFFALEGNGSTKGIIVTLDSVDTYWLFSETYSPASFRNLNIITEDILSMPGGVTGVFNIFELDKNMKVIPELMQRDIEKYGLFTYEEWAEHLTPEEFEAFNVRYVKVAIGKGLNTMEDLIRIAHMVTKR